jgi:hypothetical protein
MLAFFGFMRLTLIGSARTHPVERERERDVNHADSRCQWNIRIG